MNKESALYIKNILIPGVWLSLITGVSTGAVVFLFKIAANGVLAFSAEIYDSVRANPVWLPLLLLGAAAIGFVISIILYKVPDCRGGGIPTAIASLRGYSIFTKIISIFALFISSSLTYLVGVPLATEGPSVQMGTLIGWGVTRVFSRKDPAWERYVMTSGACAGFAAASGAPLTAILLAIDEAHLRVASTIVMFASLGTVFSAMTSQILCHLAGISPKLFDFHIQAVLPVEYIWVPLIIGVVCGLYAIVFTKGYRGVSRLLNHKLSRVPLAIKVVITCTLVAVCGFFSSGLIGTGHSLIEELVHGRGIWYVLVILLCVRVIFLMFANIEGITGGLFIPLLSFGAIIGALCGDLMCYIGILPSEYYVIAVIVGMASFISASSRTPLMAFAFAIEMLCGFSNALPIALGVTLAFVTVEASRVAGFNDTVVEGKIEAYNEGRERKTYDVDLKVGKDAFVVGKEIREILWPPNCVIVSVSNNPDIRAERGIGLAQGDILHMHYSTHYPEYTRQKLEELVGKGCFESADNID